MRISIVTPTYNSGKFIEATLKSIHDQGYSDLEHIVIDGLSSDDTLNTLEKYKNKLKWISEKDKGQSDAINKGFRQITGEIVAWQNADDLYEEDTFQFVSEYFEANPDIGLLYGEYKEIDEDGNLICVVNSKKWSERKFKLGRFCPVQPVVFWRKSVLDEVGELDLDLHFCMDVDFYSRIVKKGFGIANVNKVLGSFRVHDESKTQNESNRLKHKREYFQVLSRHFHHRWWDRILFELYYIRSFFASKIKRALKL